MEPQYYRLSDPEFDEQAFYISKIKAIYEFIIRVIKSQKVRLFKSIIPRFFLRKEGIKKYAWSLFVI
jgi:hypothetical protein